MNRVNNITKESLINYLKEGKTTRQIGNILNIPNTTISRYIRLMNLTYLYDKPKYPSFILKSIYTKEMAYLIGFILADAAIKNEVVEISTASVDKELVEFLSRLLSCKVREDDTLDQIAKRFPRARIKRKIRGINRLIGGEKKECRNVPIIRRDLEKYLVRGIFDADGCITWGYRKDRNRLWHKVSFTSSLSILISVQKILLKLGISTVVRPKSNERCFVLEFANRKDIIAFYDYIYSDTNFIPLKRKFIKYNALRLELGEFGGTTGNCTIPSRATDFSVEGVETTGELNGVLNNQSSTQG